MKYDTIKSKSCKMRKIYLFVFMLSFSLTAIGQKVKIASSMVKKLTFNNNKVIINDDGVMPMDMGNVVVQMALPLDENSSENVIDKRYKAVSLSYKPQERWNTLTLPFTPTPEFLEQMFGENYQVYTFDGYKEGKIYITKLDDIGDIEPGQPLIVYAAEGATLGSGPFSLTDVILYGETQNVVDDNSNTSFWGTFASLLSDQLAEKNFELTMDGIIQKIKADDTFKAFHSYFDLTSVSDESEVFILNVEGEDIPTFANPTEFLRPNSTKIYDFHGRLTLHPSKNIYIIDGKKIAIQ